jgi:hypothetical protein
MNFDPLAESLEPLLPEPHLESRGTKPPGNFLGKPQKLSRSSAYLSDSDTGGGKSVKLGCGPRISPHHEIPIGRVALERVTVEPLPVEPTIKPWIRHTLDRLCPFLPKPSPEAPHSHTVGFKVDEGMSFEDAFELRDAFRDVVKRTYQTEVRSKMAHTKTIVEFSFKFIC